MNLSPSIENFLKLILTASLLLSSMAVATHHHQASNQVASIQSQDVIFEKSVCSCQFHTQQADDSEKQPRSNAPNNPSDHDDCLLCQLIAEFSADVPVAVEVEFYSTLTDTLDASQPVKISSRPQLRFQGRAPPIV